MKYIFIVGLLLLGACTTEHLGKSTGPLFGLNADHWTPTAADLDPKVAE